MSEELAGAEGLLTESVNPLLKLLQGEILYEKRSHAEKRSHDGKRSHAEIDYFLEKYWSEVRSWRKT